MKRIAISFLLAFICLVQLFAQKDLVLTYHGSPIDGSLYNKIQYLDSRNGQSNLGYVKGGFMSGFNNVVDNPPIPIQLESLLSSMVDQTALDGTLLLQLRYYKFYMDNDLGMCKLRINLYHQKADEYYFINRIDTLIEAKTKEILTKGSDLFVNSIANNLTMAPVGDVPFSLAQIKDIDNFEKEDIPLYVNKTFKDGLYPTFESFINQEPDTRELQPKIKKFELKEIKVPGNEPGKWRSLEPKHIYAVVINGKLYISYDNKFFLGYFDGNDIKFSYQYSPGTGVQGVSLGFGIGSGGYQGGGIGLILGKRPKETTIMKIDHLDGSAHVAN